jgi:hypothetical protein
MLDDQAAFVRHYAGWGGRLVVIGLLVIAAGITADRVAHRRYDRLIGEGREVTGEMTEFARTVVSRRHDTFSYRVHYRFDVSLNGVPTEFEGDEVLTESEYEDFRFGIGRPVTVIYVPSDPSISGFKDTLDAPFPAFTLGGCIFGGALLLPGMAALADALKARAKRRA